MMTADSPPDTLLMPAPAVALPVTHGTLLDFPRDPLAVLKSLYRQHGDIAALQDEGHRLHFIFSPELNYEVLSDANTYHSRFFAVRGPRNSSQRRLTSGLLSMNGDEHRRHRRMVKDAFLKKAIASYLPTIRALTADLLSNWSAENEFDLAQEMTEFMLRLTSTMLFGMDDRELAYELGRMIDRWVQLNHDLGMGVFVADLSITSRYDELLDMAKELEREISGMIDRHRRQPEADGNVLSLILQAHDQQGQLSQEELVGQAALIFGAAHLTTAHSLTWTQFLLAQHPSVMRPLQAELDSELSGGFPEPQQLERLTHLDRAIKESMRILPASAYSQRIASEPTRLGPFDLARGSGVIFSQFITHHRSDLYADPEAYLPARWETLKPSPYAYLPFGAGPRMCLGGPLALMILKTVLPAILQQFRMEVVPGSQIDARVISTMLSPVSGLPVRLHQADGRFTAAPVTGNISESVELREVASPLRRAA